MVNTKRNQINYALCSQYGETLCSKNKTRADCGLDHEFLIAKFTLKLNKVGKTTKPFRYDLNKISYDYAVDISNSSAGILSAPLALFVVMPHKARLTSHSRMSGSR